MAVKPIISTITPWDTTVGTNITFSYSGNLPVTAKATIKDASTLKTVLVVSDSVSLIEDGRYNLYIPANVLKVNVSDINGNGNKYSIQLYVTDNNNSNSPLSDKAYFWCFTTPEFYYQYPETEQTIEGSSVASIVVYQQQEGESLYTYRHYLYDNSKNLIRMSDHFYDESNLQYTFKGLENSTSYYIRCQGQTKSGMILDTGFIHFYTIYGEVEDYSIIGVTSDDNATVYGTTNLILIEANEDPDLYIYINSLVQLRKKKITYETNYKIARDFTLQIKITKVRYNGLLLQMHNKNYPDCDITLDSYVFDDGLLRYCLKVNNGIATYVLYTEGFEADNDDYVVVTIRRVNNVFSLDAVKVDEDEEEGGE